MTFSNVSIGLLFRFSVVREGLFVNISSAGNEVSRLLSKLATVNREDTGT